MGRVLIDYGHACYAHEGYAAQVLDDDSITGTYSDETEPRMIGHVTAACDCGWTGTTRYPTTTGPFDENAERLALAEWEHTHARPALRRLQREQHDRLADHLRTLASHSAELGHDARRDLLDQVLDHLAQTTELARQLRRQNGSWERLAADQPPQDNVNKQVMFITTSCAKPGEGRTASETTTATHPIRCRRLPPRLITRAGRDGFRPRRHLTARPT